MPDAGVVLIADLARDVARLVVPVACAGCGLEDVRLCESCSAPWWEEPFRAEEGAGRLIVVGRNPLPVWALAELDGPVHRAIGTWKDGGRRDLDPWFAAAAGRGARAVGPLLPGLAELCVVPVPSKPRSVRRRGAALSEVLAVAVARALGAPVVRALVTSGARSRGRSSVGRWDAAGVRLVRPIAPRAALLVDDVVTTGATLARAADVLEDGGGAVLGALVLAATPRRDVGRRGG